MDTGEIAYYTKTRFSKLKIAWRVERSYESAGNSFTIGFFNLVRPNHSDFYNAKHWRDCLDTYMLFNINQQHVKELDIEENYKHIVSIKPFYHLEKVFILTLLSNQTYQLFSTQWDDLFVMVHFSTSLF